jgi:hypothetical protein
MAMLNPEPLPIRWLCKPVESARFGRTRLADGRIHLWVEHDLLEGVTPAMLAWWFGHLEGDMTVDGAVFPRYRVWHPRDHIAIRYVVRGANGQVGPGSMLHLTEVFGPKAEYQLDVDSLIVRLDEGGYAHRPRYHGLRVADMDYTFESTPRGTLYRNSLTLGFRGLLGRLANGLIARFLVTEAASDAWIKHNIEEVGNFQTFLPALYAAEKSSCGFQTEMKAGLEPAH